jgi:glycosyltransferase involved in cell wall biosynthesis
VVSNPALKEELIQKGLRRLQDFSWEKTTDELMQVFRELMKEKN